MVSCMTGVLDLYCVMVENVFGSVLASIIALAILIIIILAIAKASPTFIIGYMAFFAIVFTTLYLGAVGMVIGFIGVVVYISISIIRSTFPSM